MRFRALIAGSLLLLYLACLAGAPEGALPAQASFLAPSLAHPFGTDDLGRDMLLAVAQGGRTSLLAAGLATLLALGLGLGLGLAAGLGPAWLDEALMRLAEVISAMPVLLLAVLAASLFGGSTLNLALLLGLTRWPVVARLVRIEARALLAQDFIRAALALGATPMQVARRHVLPRAAAPALAAAGIVFGGAVMAEAALAFVGLGDAAATSWGQLTAAGFGFVGHAWWVWFWPAAMLVLVSAAVALLAEPRRD